MKKRIIFALVILMTALVCVNARGVCNGTGCRVVGYSSYASSGGFSHDRTCRVVGGYYGGCANDYSGLYLQINAGMAIKPETGIGGSISIGQKFSSGMTVGLRLNGKYAMISALSAGITSTYEFTALRKYTGIFYPVIGVEAGFGGMKVTSEQGHWDAFPYVGYKAGFNFEALPETT